MGCLAKYLTEVRHLSTNLGNLAIHYKYITLIYQQVLPKCHLQNQLMLSEDVQWVADFKSPSKAALR